MVDLQRAVLSLLPWYLRWPLKLLGGIAGAISAAVQWMWRHPWQTLAAAALLAFAWAWHGWGVAEKWGRQQQQLAHQQRPHRKRRDRIARANSVGWRQRRRRG